MRLTESYIRTAHAYADALYLLLTCFYCRLSQMRLTESYMRTVSDSSQPIYPKGAADTCKLQQSMQQLQQSTVPARELVARVMLLGTCFAENDGVRSFEMRGVGYERQVHLPQQRGLVSSSREV